MSRLWISVEVFLSHSAEKFRSGTLLCCVSEKNMDKRGGEYQDFPSKNFRLTVPNLSGGGGIFSVSLLSGIEKDWIRGGGVSRVSVKNCLSHSAEKFRR